MITVIKVSVVVLVVVVGLFYVKAANYSPFVPPATHSEAVVDQSVFAYTDGYVPALTGPGLGIEIDAAEVERAAKVGHRWRNPIWRRDDGALAEW